jgi:hypothetical protein
MATRWQDITNDKKKYAAYLCSREWSVLKEQVRARSGGVCERCRSNPMDACHHLTYENKYNESLEDLQAICTPCHEFTHGKSGYDPSCKIKGPFADYAREAISKGLWPVPFMVAFGMRVEWHPLIAMIVDQFDAIHHEQSSLSDWMRLQMNDEVADGIDVFYQLKRDALAIIQARCLRVDVIGWIESGRPFIEYDDYGTLVYGELGLPRPCDTQGEWEIAPLATSDDGANLR